MQDILARTAPLVRGINRTGNVGSIIRCSEATPGSGPAGKDLLPPLEVAPGDDLENRLFGAYKAYAEKTGFHPPVVYIPEAGMLAAGESVDAAIAVEQECREKGGVGRDRARPWDVTVAEGDSDDISARAKVVKDRVCVVTGGAQGFGESIVRELVAARGIVCVADINEEGATKLCEELNGDAGKTVAIPFKGNVADEESVSGMVRSIVEKVGGIDLFISNAGILKAGGVREMELRDFEFVTRVNYIGYFLCVKHVAPVMAAQNRYSNSYFTDIIQINSKSGLEGSNRNSAYAGGKFGGIGLTQSFALELVEDNIKVNAICPGNFFDGPLWSDPRRGLFVQYLETGKVPGATSIEDVKKFYEGKVPMKRGCTGEDVVRAIYYIIEQKYETGQAVPVTGGQIMLA